MVAVLAAHESSRKEDHEEDHSWRQQKGKGHGIAGEE